MKKRLWIFPLILLLFASGCASRDVIFRNDIYRGENDLWAAEYRLDAVQIFTEDNAGLHCACSARHVLTVSYKYAASDLEDVKHLLISFETTVAKARWRKSTTAGAICKRPTPCRAAGLATRP